MAACNLLMREEEGRRGRERKAAVKEEIEMKCSWRGELWFS